jgi:hypothetical protein
MVGDTMVVGFMMDGREFHDRVTFRYKVAERVLEQFAVPQDVWYFFHDMSLSPDGRYLLYLAMELPDYEHLSVRSWPAGDEVIAGPQRQLHETDVDLHHAHWASADSFELATRTSNGTWERISGSVVRGTINVDTLRTEPQWH